MNRASFALLLAFSLASAGCATKNYVRKETGPLINKVNELDDLTAKNSRDIKDVDQRAQQGIQQVNAKTAQVDQKAMAAGQQADAAQNLANQAASRVNTLQTTVANLDNYHAVAETTVHFGFDKDALTKKAKEALDKLAAEIPNTKGYLIAIEGNTDSTGPADYNYGLSQRRADAVIQYLAQQYNVPAHKIYLVGLGKDKPAAPNRTRKGRAENRRVDVRLMTNTAGTQTSATGSPSAALQQSQ